jgi:hypothetical protein
MNSTNIPHDTDSIPTEPADSIDPTHPLSASRGQPIFSAEWAAGFIDGEGCIHIAKQTYPTKKATCFRLRVSITQNDRAVLEHFKCGVGLDACLTRVKQQRYHSKPVFTLNYDGENALKLLLLVEPHLIRKRAEAHAGIRFWVEGGIGQHSGKKGVPPEVKAVREMFYRHLRALKRVASPTFAAT